MSKKILKMPLGFYSEAQVVDCAPKALSVLTVMRIMKLLVKKNLSERKILFKGHSDAENMYGYSPALFKKMQEAFLDAYNELFDKAGEKDFVPISKGAKMLHAKMETVRDAIEEMFGLESALVKKHKGLILVHKNALVSLAPLVVPDESLYKVHTGIRRGNGGRRIEPKPNLDELDLADSHEYVPY